MHAGCVCGILRREDVRHAIVAAERLVVMTSTELMAKDRREAMDKAVNERTEARM